MLVYATCDPRYKARYGQAFLASARAAGHKAEIFADDGQPKGFAEKMYYCIWRFRTLPELLREHGSVLMLDVDTVFLRKFDPPKGDMGIFLREHIPEDEFKTLCSIFYCTDRAMDFAVELAKAASVDHMTLRWCEDQKILWDTYKAHGSGYDVARLTQDHIDWQWPTKAPIYTGKGRTKMDPNFMRQIAKWNEAEPAC